MKLPEVIEGIEALGGEYPPPGVPRRVLWRFWRAVQPFEGCWEWQGAINLQGYGRFKIAGRIVGPHQWVYEQTRGAVPPGAWVSHTCGNVACVKPDHLTLSDRSSAALAAYREGRAGKLTPDKAREIRARYRAGETNISALARAYRVARQTITDVVQGRSWAWIEGGQDDS